MTKDFNALEVVLIKAVERRDLDQVWPVFEQLIELLTEDGMQSGRFRENIGSAFESLVARCIRHCANRPLPSEGSLPEVLKTRGLASLLTTHLIRSGEQERGQYPKKSIRFDESAYLPAEANDSYVFREPLEEAIAGMHGCDRFVATLKYLQPVRPWTPDRIAELAGACGFVDTDGVRSRAEELDDSTREFTLKEIAVLIGASTKTVQRSNTRVKGRIREALGPVVLARQQGSAPAGDEMPP